MLHGVAVCCDTWQCVAEQSWNIRTCPIVRTWICTKFTIAYVHAHAFMDVCTPCITFVRAWNCGNATIEPSSTCAIKSNNKWGYILSIEIFWHIMIKSFFQSSVWQQRVNEKRCEENICKCARNECVLTRYKTYAKFSHQSRKIPRFTLHPLTSGWWGTKREQ